MTVDLQVGDSSTAFASILSTPIVLDDTTVARTVETGAIATPTLADDDQLQLVVTVAGAAGAQASGLLVTVTLREDSQ